MRPAREAVAAGPLHVGEESPRMATLTKLVVDFADGVANFCVVRSLGLIGGGLLCRQPAILPMTTSHFDDAVSLVWSLCYFEIKGSMSIY